MMMVKFTESGGKLDYNVSSAVLGTELIKLALAEILDRTWFRSAREAAPNSAQTPWKTYVLYALPSGIYALSNNLMIWDISLLGPSTFSLFSNLKIVTTTLLTSIVLSKNFTQIQWIGVFMVVLSFMVAKVDLFMDKAEHLSTTPGPSGETEAASSARFITGLGVLLVLSTLAASAGISNEWLLKNVDEDVPFMRKNAWTYQWGAAINLFFLVCSYFKFLLSDAEIPSLFQGYSLPVFLLMLTNALMGISVSLILKYFDNIVKCFMGSLVVYFTSTCSYLFLGSASVNAPFIMGMVIFTMSSFLYMGPHNDALPKVVIDTRALQAALGLQPSKFNGGPYLPTHAGEVEASKVGQSDKPSQ